MTRSRLSGRPDTREAYDRALLDVLQKYEARTCAVGRVHEDCHVRADSGLSAPDHEYPPGALTGVSRFGCSEEGIGAWRQSIGLYGSFRDRRSRRRADHRPGSCANPETDTAETLAARILEQEHRLYPQAVQLYAEGKLHVEGRCVRIQKKRAVADLIHRCSVIERCMIEATMVAWID